jgi:Kef-type K+ transport system membrane component KefB
MTAVVGAGEAVLVGVLVSVAVTGAVAVIVAVGAFWVGAALHEIVTSAQQTRAQRRTTDHVMTTLGAGNRPG